jgi:hypothetical protein
MLKKVVELRFVALPTGMMEWRIWKIGGMGKWVVDQWEGAY